jgi:hypothetical protein
MSSGHTRSDWLCDFFIAATELPSVIHVTDDLFQLGMRFLHCCNPLNPQRRRGDRHVPTVYAISSLL